ncbi:hypothetical protein F4V57_07605 [Acinetobacter qingfengensis]|uniref:Uncharacterized protein n=1 Tax=Acinetobacter qingfengensis TaxID=1262585 RepID=A0A1E7RA03_9GAMM|nr:hypothetical protein [Acinetobacter qingfengensis]KAA8733906.1 hypothetical protein F4V57_07605 [Acinetobacter qingfengensis]OEY96174.1 hypothetical protein BJI46_12410 [Acinetobacter qingfengensis]
MNNNYIQNASAFLDNLVQEMNVELFIQQYETLDHERLSHSIPLNSKRIDNYYLFCLNNVKKNEINRHLDIWMSIIEETSKRSHRVYAIDLDLCDTVKIIKSHQPRSRNTDFIQDNSTAIFNSNGIVNKAKYNTFDLAPDIAA